MFLILCFPDARLDLSVEDNVIALALARYPARPYAELIMSDIPGPSNLRSARSSASRSSPASTLGVPPIGLTAATPTRGEILVHLGAMSWKSRSVKRKKSSSSEKDRPAPAKVQKLGAFPTSPAQEPERASSPSGEALLVLSSPPSSKPVVKAKNADVELPLTVVPITVWNPPAENAKLPPRGAAELKRKKLKPKVDENKDSLLSNAELAAGAIYPSSRILTLGGRRGCLLMRLWHYLFRGLPL